MFAQDQIERAVRDMRAQFLTVSGQIADELTRLSEHVAASPPGVRDGVVMAVAQIASTQQFLRGASERLPAEPHERYAIMESVLQAQQGALHQLAIIVKQHAPGWYPNLSTAARSPNLGNVPGGDQGPPAAATWYPSPPTVQDLATHGWPQAHGNGYGVDMQSPGAHAGWPNGGYAGGEMVPYGSGLPPDASVHAPWPGRRGYALVPTPHPPRELRPARGHGANTGQALATARRRAELVVHGAGSNNLFWIGLVVLALLFAYLSFPWEIRRLEAIANQKPSQDTEERASLPAAEPPPRVVSSAPPIPTVFARAEPEPPPAQPGAHAPASPDKILPGGLLAGSPNVAIGNFWPGPVAAAPVAREPSAEAAPVEPTPSVAARTKQRTAPSRVEPETPRPPEAAARAERFVPVLFTHQNEETATQAFAVLQQQYPKLLANRESEAQAVDLGKKGVWHRLVVLPAGSRQDASDLCAQLTGAGYGRCWVKPY